jgi:hypothetical protein
MKYSAAPSPQIVQASVAGGAALRSAVMLIFF